MTPCGSVSNSGRLFPAISFACGAPPARQRFGPRRTASDGGEKLGDVATQGFGETFQHRDRWVFQTTFHAADVCAVNLRIHRQQFLGELLRNAQPPQIPCN